MLTLGSYAADHNAMWQKANAFYQQRQYDSAAAYYEQIAAQQPQNATLYYNLGNAYYRMNKVALSVLNYERALQINPEYADAKDNLALAHNRIPNHIANTGNIFFINWWQSLTDAGKANTWALLALVSFVLMMTVLLARRFPQAVGVRVPGQLAGVFGFACVCFLIPAYPSARNNTNGTAAVVMQNDAPLMNSEQKGKPLALVPEATTVKINREKAGWAEVTLPDGRTGWLQLSLINKI